MANGSQPNTASPVSLSPNPVTMPAYNYQKADDRTGNIAFSNQPGGCLARSTPQASPTSGNLTFGPAKAEG